MKKRIFVIASVIVVIALVAGSVMFFTTKNKDDAVDDDILGSSPSEVTLTFYFPGDEPKGLSAILEELQKRTKSELNSKLVFKFLNFGDYIATIRDVASSSEACDAFFYSSQLGLSLSEWEKEGIIMDLSRVFPQDAPKYYSKFSKDELKAANINSKLLAVPNRLPTTQRKHALVRDDLMKKYNIPDIKSYSDYELYLKTVKSNESTVIPAMIYDTSIGLFAEANGYVVLDRNLGLVYKWDDPNMKIMPWEQTPEFKSSVNTVLKWLGNGYINPGDYSEAYSYTATGKTSSTISVTGSDVVFNNILQSNGIGSRYKAYSLYADKPSERSSPLTAALVLNSRTKNAGRIFKFIEWLESSQENYDLFMYGIKGKNYTLSADNTVVPLAASPQDAYENWYGQGAFSNIEYDRTTSADRLKEYMDDIENNTKYPPHLGFFPDLRAVKTEVDLRRDSYNGFESGLLNGSLNKETIDSFISGQKQNDIGKVVNAVQNQLNEWKAANK